MVNIFFFTSFSVVEGWPPDVSQNLSNYLKPNINTTLIKPNLPLGEQISWRGENYSKTHILICVHTAVNSSERRDLIRRTWAKGQLKSEWNYEVIISPKMQTKTYKDFCPTKQTRIVAKKNCLHSPTYHQKKYYVLCFLVGQKSL